MSRKQKFKPAVAVANRADDPYITSGAGSVQSDKFWRWGEMCIRDRGRIVFTPTTEVSAGFEYYLKYTTDHRILTRERLRGFDSVYLGTGADMPFTLANRYEDRRPDISPGHRYLAIVFDHTDGAQYRLAYTKDGVAEALWTEFSARTAQVTTRCV